MSSSPSTPSSALRVTLICPTIGRTTLQRLVDYVPTVMEDFDEFIVWGDGPLPAWKDKLEAHPRIRYFESPVRAMDEGCTPLDRAFAKATGDVIFLIGDDDMIYNTSFEDIRKGVAGATDKVHIFAMRHTGVILKGSTDLARVSGQQIVIPNKPPFPNLHDLATNFAPGASDWKMIHAMISRFGGPIYHDEVIANLEAMSSGCFF